MKNRHKADMEMEATIEILASAGWTPGELERHETRLIRENGIKAYRNSPTARALRAARRLGWEGRS